MAHQIKRLFTIKCASPQLLATSLERGVWGVNKDVAQTLNEARSKSNGAVALVFSINMSGHFQGYAMLSSQVVPQKLSIWGSSGNDLDHSVEVKWYFQADLSFEDTRHLRNSLNQDKLVKVTKHGQEIELQSGLELCALIQKSAEAANKSQCGPPTKPITLEVPSHGPSDDEGPLSKKRQRRSPGPMDLANITYEEYLGVFNQMKDASKELFSMLPPSHKIHQALNRLSVGDEDYMLDNFSRSEFLQVCKILSGMRGRDYSSQALADIYDGR